MYLSEHLSVAVLETLVHQDRAHLPADLVAWEVEIPDVLVETVAEIPDAWFADPLRRQTRRFGDSWAAETRTLALRLPSAVIRWEHNVLLNPLHPDTPRMQPLRAEPFEFDSRLGT